MRVIHALVAAGIAAALPSASQAQWYVGADAGMGFNQKADVEKNGTNLETSSKWGPAILGHVGYSFGHLKLEGELGWRRNGVKDVLHTNGSGHTSAYSTMINGVVDFVPEGKFHPFVGVGIGAAKIETSMVRSGGTDRYKGDGWQFAYQAFGGAAYDVSHNWAISAQYRYFGTMDYEVKTPAGAKLDAEYNNHAVLVGLSYSFGKASAMPPAPTAADPAAMHKNYIVFFDFNKSELTKEATAILNQAAAAIKKGHMARVSVTGHTDLSGSADYNMKLSKRRAEAVKHYLVRQGLKSSEISVVAKGESNPLVPTADGVREPQNRRAEIVIP